MSPSPRAFVIGHPIAHSRSPLIHGFWLGRHGLAGTYEKIDVAPEALPGFLASLQADGYEGGNVTVPHKTAALPLVGEVDADARAIGAANTLWFDQGRLVAGNTDAQGFLGSLDAEALGWSIEGGRAVVLGAGGAARAVVHALRQRGFSIDLINRSLDKGEALAKDFGAGMRVHGYGETDRLLGGADLLVNTTSLGMAGQPPLALDLAGLKPTALVCDIVYVPLETALLRDARRRGHRTIGGLGMLLHQAVPGFARWFGVQPAVTPDLRALIEADIRAKHP